MSDLDDFFAKRLDEEASFPNRGKNWKQMSQRLDAFDSGAVQGNPQGLRGWQLATLVAVAAAGFLLWKTMTLQHDNKVLRQELAAIQAEQIVLKDQLAAVEKRAAVVSAQEAINEHDQNIQSTATQAGTDSKAANPTINTEKSLNKKTPDKPASLAGVQAEKLPEYPSKDFTEKQSYPTVIEEKSKLPEAADLTENKTSAPDTAAAQSSKIAQITPALDSLKNAPPKADSLLVVEEKPQDSITTVSSVVQEIKPVHTAKKRFRIGTQATIGFVQPKQKGVSALRGQGITVETKIFRSLWLTASVDWLHHEICTEEFVPKFYPHHDSLPKPHDNGSGGGGGGGGGGWQHPAKLVLVESAPRQQHFGLGLRYELPVHFWVRPSLRVAHDWVHVSPTLITYKFEEDDPGGPSPGPDPHDHDAEYTAEKFDAQWLNDQWRFGLGLEKDIPNWTFGLWADYSKDFSAATPSFDALYLRAGAQYRF